MRKILALALVLYSPAAFAQDKPPPTVGGRPLVQVKPKAAPKAAAPNAADPDAAAPKAAAPKAAAAKAAAAKSAAPKGKPQSIAVRLQACLDIDDETKERLTCYDAVFPPKPKAKAPAAKGVNDCAGFKEEDERLKCFNGFAEKIPKLPK